MKNAKYILLVIGILGMIASMYGFIKDQDISSHIIGFICGASLVFGYFELKKTEK